MEKERVLGNSIRPSSLASLFSQTYQIEPKPWSKISTDLYYELEGEFIVGENYWKGGSLLLKETILELKGKLQNKETESQVIDKVENHSLSELFSS